MKESERIRNQIVTDQLILEGVGSSRTEFRKYLGLSIFVETPREICISRGVARDLEVLLMALFRLRSKYWD